MTNNQIKQVNNGYILTNYRGEMIKYPNLGAAMFQLFLNGKTYSAKIELCEVNF